MGLILRLTNLMSRCYFHADTADTADTVDTPTRIKRVRGASVPAVPEETISKLGGFDREFGQKNNRSSAIDMNSGCFAKLLAGK
jgi:hypothetical protein